MPAEPLHQSTPWDGRPATPESDGWHWVQIIHGISQPRPRLWWSKIDRWELSDGTLISPGDFAERWRCIGPCVTPAEASECDVERIEFMNRLGRVTEHLGLAMDATGSRIIEVIRERVAAEREAWEEALLAADEAWEEALLAADEAWREAFAE